MNCKQFLLTAVLIILTISQVFGQNFTVNGTISDSISKESLFYANVVIITKDSTAKTISHATSDVQGKFELVNVPSGDYLLKATYVGYDVYTQPITLKGNNKKLDIGTISLTSHSTTLGAVEVTAKKPVYAQEGEKTLYNVSEDPTIQSGTASDALQNAPGVEVDIEGNITLRGVSSVEIWINNKPSHLNEESLKNYIQQLPANSLQRIEVITNPSARYSAQGTGGIINIVTNDNIKRNSFYSFGLRGSSNPSIAPWFSYVWSNNKWDVSVYTYGNYWNWNSKNHGYNLYLDEQKDTSTYETFSDESKNHGFSGGLFLNGSCKIDSMNDISFWLGGYGGNSIAKSSGENFRHEYIFDSAMYHYTTDQDEKSNYLGGYAGTWYQHRFNDNGHLIEGNIGGNYWSNNQKVDFIRHFETQDYLNKDKINKNEYNSYSFDASVDYTLPYIKNGEIALGIGGDYGFGGNWEESDTLVSEVGNYQLDSLRFVNADVKNSELESYITIQHKFGNFIIKGGLRAEFNNYDVLYHNSPKDNLTKSYMGWYPSLHLSYRTKSMHNFKLSYTRRVANPEYDELTTFINYGEDSYSTGNPDLLQTFTNSFEGGWTKYFNKFGNVGLNGYFKNYVNEVNTLNDVAYSDIFGRIVNFSMPVNSGKSYRTGLEANITYKLKSFMQVRFYGNVYYSNTETEYQRDLKTVVTENLGYSLRINYWAKLWNVLEVNASGNYRSKNKTLFMETDPIYSINCGLRADFLDRKISVYLNANDIFNWNKKDTNRETPYYVAYNSQKYSSRYIGAGVTFRFGKIELESKSNQGQGQQSVPNVNGQG
ncbi:MAG: outer membrane beta-barrel family protein [Bacteroidales bacterium]|nr:outer membrane beta-barrel family protein [Bacteroidales bacterium]